MSKPKFSLEMRGSSVFKNADLEAAAGSEFTIEYDPAKASLSIDYSSEDHLTLVLTGEANLKAIGFPSLTVGSSVQLDKDGLTVSGSLEWTISKALAAKAEIERTPSSTGGTMTLTIRF